MREPERGGGNAYFKELLINIRVFHSMNKKSVFARRLAARAPHLPPTLLPPRSRVSVLLAFHLEDSQSHFAPLMDSYIITGASRSRITLDKYHRERKDMKFSCDESGL